MPCLWKNSNILGLDWLDQITNDNGILILAAGVFLRLNNILRFPRYFKKTLLKFNYCKYSVRDCSNLHSNTHLPDVS